MSSSLSPSINKGKVTAGLPGLSPSLRSRKETQEKSRFIDKENLKDEAKRASSTVAPIDGIKPSNVLAQMGRPLTSQVVQKKLKEMNPAFYFEISIADKTKTGIYLIENKNGEAQKRFICGMESGVMPEFSIKHEKFFRQPDPSTPGNWLNVPVLSSETRGWRTVLARLYRERLITAPQITAFFAPEAGQSRQAWQQAIT